MRLPCFSRPSGSIALDQEQAPRTPRKKRISRQGSNQSNASRCSTASNSSISKLPPCKRVSDPKIEAMMMAVPPEPRASRCLRMSHPKIYGDIVSSMKATKGCRDWASFPVFHQDEIDMTMSADEVGRKRAADYERKLRQLNSFSSSEEDNRSIDIDMIG